MKSKQKKTSKSISTALWAIFDVILYVSAIVPTIINVYQHFTEVDKNLQLAWFAASMFSNFTIFIAIIKAGLNKPGLIFAFILLVLQFVFLGFPYALKDALDQYKETQELTSPLISRISYYKASLLSMAGFLFSCNVTTRTTVVFLLWAMTCFINMAAIAYKN